VERGWCGNFLTALEMPGCSLSVMKVDDTKLARLDASADAPAWPGRGCLPATRRIVSAPQAAASVAEAPPAPADETVRRIALAVAAALDAHEPELTALDSVAGDGDLGLSLARGAAAIRALPDGVWANGPTALTAIAGAVRRAIAGSSGPFYATALLRAAAALRAGEAPSPIAWAEAFRAGVAAIADLGGARPGDRTMLDALHPAVEAFAAAVDRGEQPALAWAAAVAAADAGVTATAAMRPRLGRASYLGDRAIGSPDAGAAAVAIWLRAIGTELTGRHATPPV